MKYQRLTDIRKTRGISQLQMAQFLGLGSKNAYAQKERGLRRFSVEEGMAVARLLGQPVEKLFFCSEVNKMVTQRESEGGQA